MANIELPAEIRDLLQGSRFEPAVLELVSAVSAIAEDNKTPFFPGYTDHGVTHLSRVLHDAMRLVPDSVGNQDLLTDADAAILTGASLLHDIGMHLRPSGFLTLISGDWPEPEGFFAADHSRRPADRPWPEAWDGFKREMRHMNSAQASALFGPDAIGVPRIALGDSGFGPAEWTENDYLAIGEFVRRHHARVAHETAKYGFPGSDKTFPRLADTAKFLAEPIGAVARSHGESLRVMLDFCD